MVGDDTNRILIDFDAVIDTDVGIAKVINKRYNNPALINQKMIRQTTESYKFLLLNRIYQNPLFMFMNEEYRSSANDLYREMITTDEVYQDILKNSTTTGIFNMVLEMINSKSSCIPTILCKNQTESDYIKSILVVETIIADPQDTVDMSNFDTVIVKFVEMPKQRFTNLEGKNVFICKYRFNLNADKDSLKTVYYAELTMNANDVYTIGVYDESTLDANQ